LYKYHIYRYIEKIFSIAYKQIIIKDTLLDLNPFFLEYNMETKRCYSRVLMQRSDYEQMNGFMRDSIPSKLLLKKFLEDFFKVCGIMGLSIDDKFTSYLT
jgi:hypothetical protein